MAHFVTWEFSQRHQIFFWHTLGPWGHPGETKSWNRNPRGLAPEHSLAGFQCLGRTTEPRNSKDIAQYWEPWDWIGLSKAVRHYRDSRQKSDRPSLTKPGKTWHLGSLWWVPDAWVVQGDSWEKAYFFVKTAGTTTEISSVCVGDLTVQAVELST